LCYEGLAKGRVEAQEKAYHNSVDESLAKGSAKAQEKAYQKGFEEGKELVHAKSQSTHEALSKRACNLQIQLADAASLLAHSSRKEVTAAAFVVQCKQRDNRIAELDSLLESTFENEVQHFEELLRIVAHQASKLEELHTFQSSCQTSLASSAKTCGVFSLFKLKDLAGHKQDIHLQHDYVCLSGASTFHFT
jgi:hypothetical protein